MAKDNIGANKALIIVPIILLLAGAAVLVGNFAGTGEWFERSINLKGGTLVSVRTSGDADTTGLESALSQQFGDVVVRELRSFSGSSLTVQVETGTDTDAVKQVLEDSGIDTTDSSVETIGPSLGESFWVQAQISIIAAFLDFKGV